MTHVKVIIVSALLKILTAAELDFPQHFKFGAASSSYQIEGGWNAADKGESIWDRFTHVKPSIIADDSTGDVACDSYHHWKEDVQLAANMGLQFYRFSISWPRILPTGFPNYVSKDGINYYNNLIDELLANGIEPIVTLYHWELPQKLQDLGGWTNPLISDWFASYARIIYSNYADRIETWLTFNEPVTACDMAYNSGVLAPGIVDPDRAGYLCTKHALIAHAKAWRIYDKEYKPKFRGRMTLANQNNWHGGVTDADHDIAELANWYSVGRFAHPVYSKEGGWPPVIEEIIANNSKEEGYHFSRLPPFTQEEIELVRGTYDFYALNHYTSRLVRKGKPGEKLGAYPVGDVPELRAKLEVDKNWKFGTSTLFPMYPEGLRKIINWLRKFYGHDLEIFISECGWSSTGSLNDDDRIDFLKSYLGQVLLAIKEDGANVTGFGYWTLLDNFEWMDGYETKFGLHKVDFNDPNRKRTPRKSAIFYSKLIKNHSLDIPTIPDIPDSATYLSLYSMYLYLVIFFICKLF